MHLPVHLPCYDLSPLGWPIVVLFNLGFGNIFLWKMVVVESDGRCVRAPGPASKELSVFFLLLNPPLNGRFHDVVRNIL